MDDNANKAFTDDELFRAYQQATEQAETLTAQAAELKRQAKERGVEVESAHESPKREVVTRPASELALLYIERLRAGKVHQLIPQSDALEGIEVGSGLITIIGAPPGFGKTALAMQIVFDGLRLDPQLTATIANAETTFDGLLRRELARRSKIKSDNIRFGRLTHDELAEIESIVADISPVLSRIAIVEDCTLGNIRKLYDEPPGLLVIDYLQKFSPPGADARTGVGQVMAEMRVLAKAGWAVVCLSATARQQNGKGEPKELTISSYRDSGEIEFNADSCYLLVDCGPIDASCEYIRKTELKHVKNRHGAKVDKPLRFHMPRMSFEAQEEVKRHSEFDAYEFDEPSDNPFAQGGFE
jgi:hypothetical protein